MGDGEVTDQSLSGRVRELVEPALAEAGIEVFDVEQHAKVLKVTIDRPGGVDLESVSAATRIVSDELDRSDIVSGRYLLEVSSPGIERRLRTPSHFLRALGSEVTIKARPGFPERRVDGVLQSADDDGIVVAGRRLTYPDIQSARTRFVWSASQPARQKARP